MGEEDEEPPAPGLMLCRYACACMICERPTRWRALTFDVHICSSACFFEARLVLECRRPESPHD